jgi:hypothetical protein
MKLHRVFSALALISASSFGHATVYNAGSLGYNELYTNGPLNFTESFSDTYTYTLLNDVGTVDFVFNIGDISVQQSLVMHLVGPGIDITQTGTNSVFIQAFQAMGDYTVYVSGNVQPGQTGTYYFGIATGLPVDETSTMPLFLGGISILSGLVLRRKQLSANG